MDMSAETFKLLIMLATNMVGIIVAVSVIKTQIKGMDKRIEKNEANIVKLFDDTRYVMTGNEIRRIIDEEIQPLTDKMEQCHNDVLFMKARNSREVN